MKTKMHNIYLLAVFLLFPLFLSVSAGYKQYNDANKENEIKIAYHDYGHDARIGRYIDINGENLKVVNHNFWASTYTLSNGVEVDDDYVDEHIKAGYSYNYTVYNYPRFEGVAVGVFVFIIYYAVVLAVLQSNKKSGI